MTPKLPPPQPLRLPSSVLLLLLSILIIPTSSHAYNVSASCNTTSTCGNLIKISYPFCFYEEIDVLSSSYCGYEGFKVTCGNNTPFLHSNDAKKYKITHIDYDAHIISIVDADIFSDQCLRLRHNFTLSPLSTLRYASSDANLTFFFDCADGPAEYRIPCFGHRPRNQSYVLTSEAMANSSRSPRNCDEVVVAPVLEDLLQSCNPNDLPNIYGRVLRGGFNLSWPHESSGQCNRCESSGGRCGLSQTSNSTWPFTCFCLDGIKTFPYCGAGVAAKKKINILSVLIVIVMALASAVPFMLFLSVFVYIMCSRKPHKNNWQNAELFLQQHESLIQKRYKYSEVQRMTKSFSNKLGQGGFGSVYKGTLQDGRIVAVKLLSESEGDGGEFINEVASISKTSHVNVVTLLGFCLEKSKRALIYEFMPNGSLEKFVYSDRSNTETQLDCEKLYEIATGIARGLEYLHNGCNTRIVHFDIKPHNILLDHNCCPKISDFGLAKLCPSRESIISMATARGTIGYIAPEVFSRSFGVVSSKSDVYSYGMMLLEIVGGRKKMDAENERSSEVYFPQWIYDDIDRYCKVGIPGITSETEEFMRKMTVVGLWCIQIMPENRPPMSKVVEMLNGSVDDLQIPPRP